MDVRQVADAMGYDPRIGKEVPVAGLGFGSPCLPKDLRAVFAGTKQNGVRLERRNRNVTPYHATKRLHSLFFALPFRY